MEFQGLYSFAITEKGAILLQWQGSAEICGPVTVQSLTIAGEAVFCFSNRLAVSASGEGETAGSSWQSKLGHSCTYSSKWR